MKSNKQILSFALPAIAENFLQMFVGLSDTFLVSTVGLAAVAGVSLANNLITVYQAIFIALGAISSSLVARKIAEKKQQETSELISSILKLTLLFSLGLALISLFFAAPILQFLGGRGQMLAEAKLYLALVGTTIVLLALMTIFGAFLRAKSDSKTPMYASLLTNLLNIIFSLLFVFGFNLDVMGVALGSILARLIGVIYLQKKLSAAGFRLKLSKGLFPKTLVAQLLPATGERLVMRLGDLLVIMMIGAFGSKVFAGNAIGESITQFNYMPAFGMATATVVLVAQSFAQNDFEAIKSYTKRTYWISTGLVFLVSLLIFLFGRGLTGLFTGDVGAISASLTVILFALLTTPFLVGTTTYTAVFQGMGNAKLPFYTTTIGMFAVRVSLGLLLGIYFGLGLTGVWLAVLFDNLFRFIFLKIQFKKLTKI